MKVVHLISMKVPDNTRILPEGDHKIEFKLRAFPSHNFTAQFFMYVDSKNENICLLDKDGKEKKIIAFRKKVLKAKKDYDGDFTIRIKKGNWPSPFFGVTIMRKNKDQEISFVFTTFEFKPS